MCEQHLLGTHSNFFEHLRKKLPWSQTKLILASIIHVGNYGKQYTHWIKGSQNDPSSSYDLTGSTILLDSQISSCLC